MLQSIEHSPCHKFASRTGAIGLARLIAKQGEAPSQGIHVILHVLFIVQTAFLRNTMDHEPRQAYEWHSD